MTCYSLDSSALIEGGKRYPASVFPTLWSRLGEFADRRLVLVSDEVAREAERKDDEAAKWVAEHRHACVPTDAKVVEAPRQVQRACPNLPPSGATKSQADPFVVAVALLHAGTVVTEERLARSHEMPKIPNACKLVDVTCTNLVGFLREQGWQF